MKKYNLDLVRLLKNHIGETFYSPMFGKGIFVGISNDISYPIVIKDRDNNSYSFSKEGFYAKGKNTNPECLLFPSKTKRSWDDFNRQPKEEFYYYIVIKHGNIAEVNSAVDRRSSFDNNNFINGNYFINKLDALKFKDKINELFISNKVNLLSNT